MTANRLRRAGACNHASSSASCNSGVGSAYLPCPAKRGIRQSQMLLPDNSAMRASESYGYGHPSTYWCLNSNAKHGTSLQVPINCCCLRVVAQPRRPMSDRGITIRCNPGPRRRREGEAGGRHGPEVPKFVFMAMCFETHGLTLAEPHFLFRNRVQVFSFRWF